MKGFIRPFGTSLGSYSSGWSTGPFIFENLFKHKFYTPADTGLSLTDSVVGANSNITPAPPVGPFTDLTSEQFYPTTNPAQTISKLHVHDVYSSSSRINGITLIEYPSEPTPVGQWSMTDLITERIGNAPYDAPAGTQNAGIAIGYSVHASRLIANGQWMGIETWARCQDSIIEDFVVAMDVGGGVYTGAVPLVGVYCEHVTTRTIFQRFDVRANNNGFNVEWTYGGVGSSFITFRNGMVYCAAGQYGIFLDAGTYGCVIQNVTFWGPGNAIGTPNNMVDPTHPNTFSGNTFNQSGANITFHNNLIG